jgi:predicted Zn-dependent protease
METQKKLKLIPLHQFFKIMDRPSKAMYLLLYCALLLSSVVLTVALNDPSQWVVEVDTFHAQQLETVPLRTFEWQYRSMDTEIGAWQEDVTYFASPMQPKSWIVMLFCLLQIIGWAYLLTAASYIKNYVSYVAFFFYGMAIYLSGAFEMVAPDHAIFFNIGLTLLVFVPAYLFQQTILNWRFAFRLPLFFAVTALPFVLVYVYRDWVGIHATSVSMFPLLVVLGLVYCVFVAKDLAQLVFFLGSNAKNPKWRLTPTMYLAVLVPVASISFLMMHNAMGWHFLESGDFPLKAMHFLAFMSILMPGLNQNIGLTVKESINNRSFSMLVTAFGLVSVSSMFLQVGLGDYLYLHAIERLFSVMMFLGVLVHSMYMFYNFGPLLSARLNLYFLTMMPKRLMYVFVWGVMVLAALGLDASEGMKTQRLLKAVAFNRSADQEMLEGKTMEAIALYQAAATIAEGSVKANYNQAMLLMQVGGDGYQIRECLRKASGFVPFVPAWLNLGNLELSDASPDQAKRYLKQGLELVSDAKISNNLAQAYLLLDQPDSAVMSMKQALLQDPENPNYYANLGKIYLQHGKLQEAKKFLQEGLSLDQTNAAVVTNALFLNLKADAGLKIDDRVWSDPEILSSRSSRFNHAVDRYKSRDYKAASSVIDTLLAASETPDVLFLDGMLRFERGDWEGAISRMAFMDVNHPEYSKYTNHFLGVAFFSAGIPEMASAFFEASGSKGRMEDLLNHARMEIDRGDLAKGFALLNQARTIDTTLMSSVAREEALLQLANGEYLFASIGFDLKSLSADEWTRAGIYAGMKGNKGAALEAFRNAIEKDPKTVAPYLEMGRISIRTGDSLALENLEAGLKKNPKHLGLRVEQSRALMMANRIEEGRKQLSVLLQEAPQDPAVLLLQAEFSAATGDTSLSIKQYKTLLQTRPLDQAVVLPLARLMRQKRMDFEGQNLLANVLMINPRNAEYWAELAYFERLLDRTQEVAGAARRAVSLTPNPDRAKQISTEFAVEMKAFPPIE